MGCDVRQGFCQIVCTGNDTSLTYDDGTDGYLALCDGNYMARQLGMSPASFSHRLTGRLPWHADEMYAVMDILKIPQESMHECFPDMRKKGARR